MASKASTATRTLGSVMAGVRVSAQLRQKDLAGALSFAGEERVSHIENDKAPVTVGTFIEWCRACGTAPEEVIRTIPGY